MFRTIGTYDVGDFLNKFDDGTKHVTLTEHVLFNDYLLLTQCLMGHQLLDWLTNIYSYKRLRSTLQSMG